MASPNGSSGSSGGGWTPWQNKLFENAIAIFDQDTPDRWQNIAKAVGGGKTVEEIKRHYEDLLEDIAMIEAGLVPLPNYGKPPRHPSSPAARASPSVANRRRPRDDAQSSSEGSEASVNWPPKTN